VKKMQILPAAVMMHAAMMAHHHVMAHHAVMVHPAMAHHHGISRSRHGRNATSQCQCRYSNTNKLGHKIPPERHKVKAALHNI
jgi:hypothetical protein